MKNRSACDKIDHMNCTQLLASESWWAQRRAAVFLQLVMILLSAPYSAIAEETNRQVRADIWADNWFALFHGDTLLVEDSVPYRTERSFNSESTTFRANMPVTLSVVIKDFKQDDTGLEYIGSRRQQMGDGGFIAQFRDAASGELLGVSDQRFRCIVIHRAPLDRTCERSADPQQSCNAQIDSEPAGWKSEGFDDDGWPAAVIHSEQAVRPHGGYDDIRWDSTARLIWAEDLEIDNTLLCRFELAGP
jgi:hypothetical protein